MEKQKITQNTTLKKILEIKGTEKILEEFNLPCLFCAFAKMEMEKLKIGEICDLYGIDKEKLLKKLNEFIVAGSG